MRTLVYSVVIGFVVMLIGSSLLVAGLPNDALTPAGIILRDNTSWIWK